MSSSNVYCVMWAFVTHRTLEMVHCCVVFIRLWAVMLPKMLYAIGWLLFTIKN